MPGTKWYGEAPFSQCRMLECFDCRICSIRARPIASRLYWRNAAQGNPYIWHDLCVHPQSLWINMIHQQGERIPQWDVKARAVGAWHCTGRCSWEHILKANVKFESIEKGRKIHYEVSRQELLEHSIGVVGALIDMYTKCGDLCEAHGVVEAPFLQQCMLVCFEQT